MDDLIRGSVSSGGGEHWRGYCIAVFTCFYLRATDGNTGGAATPAQLPDYSGIHASDEGCVGLPLAR